jgi:hypothetical protein
MLIELYREDTNPESPNQALKAFWPSTSSLRTTRYSAGKRLGPDAAKLLERIDDSDLHRFAQIVLVAALAGRTSTSRILHEAASTTADARYVLEYLPDSWLLPSLSASMGSCGGLSPHAAWYVSE